MYKTVRGLVLREVKYKESSKMLTLLTDEGKMAAEARGALRKGSRIGAASQQLCYSEMTVFENRGRRLITEAAVLEEFTGVRERWEDFALSAYIAEVLEAVALEGTGDPAMLRLGLNTLFALSRQLYPSEHIKAVFELRMLCLAGFTPEVERCSHCGAVTIEHPRLSLLGGAVHCAHCPPPVPGRSAILCPASLAALRHVAHASEKKIFSFTLDESAARHFDAACENFTLTQLDRGFPTLDYWKSAKG